MRAKEILDEFHDNIIAVMDSHEDKYHKAVDEAQEKALLALKEMVEGLKKPVWNDKMGNPITKIELGVDVIFDHDANEFNAAITAVTELFGGRK
jgi:hypothetical protein